MLLHHAAFTDDHSTICRLLCCSAEIQALILSHCAGLVTLSATDAVPHAWLWHYVPLLRGISLDYRLLSAGARSHAQESLGKSLQELEPRLKLCVFTSAHDRVSVNLLKRLPVRGWVAGWVGGCVVIQSMLSVSGGCRIVHAC